MQVETISATSLEAFECPSRFWAEKVMFAQDMSGVHADLGTACHEALERWVAEGWYKHRPMPGVEVIQAFFIEAYFKLFAEHTEFFDQGMEMVEKWYRNQDWNGVEVVTTEQKERFLLSVPGQESQKVTYIFDRLDLWTRESGMDPVPRVVDYKTVGQPISADDMKKRIQPRLYGCAAQLLYPEAPGVWVEYDLLRYDRVGVYFSKEENRDTYKHLQSQVRRIRATEPLPPREGELDITEDNLPRYQEVLNPNCRWCVRRHSCKTLQTNIAVGGVFSLDDVNAAIDRSARIKSAVDAAKKVKEELDEFIMRSLVEDEASEAETDETEVSISSRNITVIDPERAARIVGPEVVARYAKLTLAQVKEILKDPEVDDATKSALKGLMVKKRGSAFLRFKSKKVED